MYIRRASTTGRASVQPEAEGEGPSADGEMETFYAKVQEVRDKMAQMSQGQQQLLRLHEQSKTAVQVDKTRRIRDQVLRQAKVVKADVDYLEKANAAALGRVRLNEGSISWWHIGQIQRT
jgi:hypothetical protein